MLQLYFACVRRESDQATRALCRMIVAALFTAC
jgi:hypothetical protein